MNSQFRSEVVIVHRHLAPYRVPLFETLRTLLRADGINLRLIHGVPRTADVTRYAMDAWIGPSGFQPGTCWGGGFVGNPSAR